MTTNKERLLTPAQAGALLGLPTRRVLRLALPRVVYGYRTVRYDLKDLETYMDEHRRPLPPPLRASGAQSVVG